MEGQSPQPPQVSRISVVPTPVSSGISWKVYLLAVMAMLLALASFAAGLLWWYQRSAENIITDYSEVQASSGASLGVDLYRLSLNPLEEALPKVSVPVANPLDDAYQNPFE